MGFEGFIANKHLTHRRKTGFISLISVISVLGVGVGVMAMIVVLAVMSGFSRELKAKIVNVQPHLRIERIGAIEEPEKIIKDLKALKIEGVKAIAPFVEGQAIVQSERTTTGVVVKGLDLSREDSEIYKEKMVYGQLNLEDRVASVKKRFLLFFKKSEKQVIGSVLLGEGLAARLRVRVGDRVNLISPVAGEKGNLLSARAESLPFHVKGIFRMGMNDFDQSLVLVSVSRAQKLYHLDERVTGISLRFEDVDAAQKWKYLLQGEFTPDYYLRSWYDMNHNFFQALKVEKSVMTIILALIVLVAAFNIISTIMMIVMEKTRDIGVLRALGATRASIRKIFLFEGFQIGLVGVFMGTVSGLLLAYNLNQVSDFLKRTTGLEVFPSDVYYFDRIPAEVHGGDVAIIVAVAVIASILAGLYPAHRAARLHPVEALRYE